MATEPSSTPYSIQEIKLVHGTEYFFVLEEATFFTIFQINRASARQLRNLLHHIALDQGQIKESLLLLAELNKSNTSISTILFRGHRRRRGQKLIKFTLSRSKGSCRVCKRRTEKSTVRATSLGLRGYDFAAVVCSETLSRASTSFPLEACHPRPYRWSRKHDDLLLLAQMPYDAERLKVYLEFHQLLVCSSEWLEHRREELLEDGKDTDFSLRLWM